MRYKEVSESEDAANRKVLQLLDDIANLTRENQELLQGQSRESQEGFYYAEDSKEE